MNTKGIAFTITVLLFLSVLFLIAHSLSRHTLQHKQESEHARIRAMNDFLQSFHTDSERAIQISAFRALIALEDYVSKNAKILNNTESYFVEIFYRGNLSEDNTTFDIMNASTFLDYQNKVHEIARLINLNFTSTVQRVNLSMADPWTVKVDVALTVLLSDLSGLAEYSYTTTVFAYVPIIDLRDPLYSVNTEGKLPVQIRKSPFTVFVNDTNNLNDTTNLQAHLNNSYYINSTLAPNFLMRFEKNLSPDPNGIESLVNLQVLADQGYVISTNNRSVVDYIYFGTYGHENYCNIQNMIFFPENWFRLDKEHADIYQINNTLTYTDC